MSADVSSFFVPLRLTPLYAMTLQRHRLLCRVMDLKRVLAVIITTNLSEDTVWIKPRF